MKIAVIGTGWYGCHLARKLLEMGHCVSIFEQTGEMFSGASGHNQNRLHLGYHYPRSHQTRYEIFLTHEQFIEKYPTKEIRDNFFAVAEDSWIDLTSYTSIMAFAGLSIDAVDAKAFGIEHVENDVLYRTKERVIDTEAVKASFVKLLEKHTEFNYRAEPVISREGVIVGCEWFNGLLDCTSGELKFQEQIYFEPAVLAEYDGPEEHFALTVMDGYFPCLYPTAKPGRWRVSHVFHTARGAFANADEARDVLDTLDPIEITDKMTEAMTYFYPGFAEKFMPRYELIKAVRTKLKNNNASRECRVLHEGRALRVFSGKICAVFLVEEEVEKWLKTL